MTFNIIRDGDEFYLGDKDRYLTENIGSNKKEVVKFIPPEQRNDPDVKRLNKIESQIISGLENPLSGTGTPIANLSGGAKENAQRANIGGGFQGKWRRRHDARDKYPNVSCICQG